MSQAKNERLLNLLICLMSTRQFVTAERIRRSVMNYSRDDSPKGQAAFERMFERDKEELRELGVTIETGTNSIFDTVPGYRIVQGSAMLPQIELNPREASVVAIAAEWWKGAQFESASTGALQKLKASGMTVDRSAITAYQPALREPGVVFETMLQAVQERREVRFEYRAPRTDATPVAVRHLQPWGLLSWRARWYVVGFDLDRGAERVFRLSRISGAVELASEPDAFDRPPELDLLSMLHHAAPAGSLTATVRLHGGERAALDRLRGQGPQPDDPDLVAITVRDVFELAAIIVPYGDQVEVISPPEARDYVAQRLEQMAALAERGSS